MDKVHAWHENPSKINSVIDLTFSESDDELQPTRPQQQHRPVQRRRAPRILDSDDDSDEDNRSGRNGSVESARLHPTSAGQTSAEEDARGVKAGKAAANQAQPREMSDNTEGEDLGEPDTEEHDEDELEQSKDSFVVPSEEMQHERSRNSSVVLDDKDDKKDGGHSSSSSDYQTPVSEPRRTTGSSFAKSAPKPPVPAPAPDVAGMSELEQLRRYGFVIHETAPARPPKASSSARSSSSSSSSASQAKRIPPAPFAPYKPPFRPIDNQPSTSSAGLTPSFSAKPVPSAFASSAKAFGVSPRAAPPAPRAISVKERAMEAMKVEQKRLGVAIEVPKNAPFAGSSASALRGLAANDEDRELAKVLKDMDLRDDLVPKDQEAALKELVSSSLDMSNVDTSEALPAGLKCQLLPHQILGLHWLKDREKGKKRGGILGDDMGLGKTVQMIALMLANPSDRKTVKSKTTLIVCPVALMQQWKDEIQNKTDGSLRVLIHHGSGRAQDGRKLQKYDVVITSYNTAASEWIDPKPKRAKKDRGGHAEEESDLDELGALASKLENGKGKIATAGAKGALFDEEYSFYRVILDEAHQIKGRTTKMHKACCDLSSRYRWCLTGTPVQNGVNDLFALFEFLGKIVNPLHQFSEFKAKIADPLKNKRTEVALARLAVVLKAIMLRRTKTMVVDGKPLLVLPAREIIEVKGPFLDAEEEAFYRAVEEKMTLSMNAFLKAGTAMQNYTQVLIKLLRMRQACNHPALVTGHTSSDDREALEPSPEPVGSSSTASASVSKDDLSSLLGSLSLSAPIATACALCQKPTPSIENSYCDACAAEMSKYKRLTFSTKIQRTIKILEDIRSESRAHVPTSPDSMDSELGIFMKTVKPKKTIIFSQFTSMFDILEPFLKQGGFKYVRFDGKLNPKQRDAALNQIRNDPRTTIILVSIKCGAVGLNLTVCSRVILLDLWWNPAIEQQAFDRAHRFGQTDDVKIYKLTIDGTVEDRILTLQTQKAELAKAALEGSGDFSKANKLSMKDMMYLFRADTADETKGQSKGRGAKGGREDNLGLE
ncbi:hypothetical protein JCM21900_002355 [Sporobolomyces salmonicolor]